MPVVKAPIKKMNKLDSFQDENKSDEEQEERVDAYFADDKSFETRSSNSTKFIIFPIILLIIEYFLRVNLDIPVGTLIRNMMLSPTPAPISGKYQCNYDDLANDVTIVVTVKDACSQAPGFINALHKMAPENVHLIYTFPNFSSCATIPGLDEELGKFTHTTKLPLPVRVSPMQGWVDAVPHIKTKYALLLHNDGYALDEFFLCELVEALKTKENIQVEGGQYVIAAPMLYESKADLSLAAHATQSNLRLVTENDAKYGRIVRHDHSLSRALNRGSDVEEGPQTEFLEDHGFLIETDKIETVIDPHASYTLEYIDMIMTIRSHNWQVLFVPTARLEFRVTEFSWRDIPYFMYKRSEVTAHGTRDYLISKWKADFPNTGFWTYIKYTIVEQHVYDEFMLSQLSWADSATIAFGFFQMAGYNRYFDTVAKTPKSDFLSVLENLENGWQPEGPLLASRSLERKQWHMNETKPTKLPIEDILETTQPKLINFEADMPLHFLPFVTLELKYPSLESVPVTVKPLCGLVIQHGEGEISCWVNLPTFKSNNKLMQFLDKFAAIIKLPSRITTFIELRLGSTIPAFEHVSPILDTLRDIDVNNDSPHGVKAKWNICESSYSNCGIRFEFSKSSKVLQFMGRPPSSTELINALVASHSSN
eukprot:CAMPEP_0114336282 /NCGR_PEP_ID=MMETSP0101-20121206/5605_1 /TAXON_ID=38822 ORGANISM="Pteridomonas danica, Strain PT" /NCGR_SAMPLE_ID=MMETSP0101 /ASSEMBLY_ACC=CAM_ASM_000211 /LENGTH=650 /DNA_ID=CAMNT_0001468157 /DNA_START=120 /DNA_END=2072 /DNA_ORIENTATION=-